MFFVAGGLLSRFLGAVWSVIKVSFKMACCREDFPDFFCILVFCVSDLLCSSSSSNSSAEYRLEGSISVCLFVFGLSEALEVEAMRFPSSDDFLVDVVSSSWEGFSFSFLLDANVVICFCLRVFWLSLGGEPVALDEDGFKIEGVYVNSFFVIMIII